ncbi:MAG: EAL domain-containing protein [Thauera sp.]|nr:EAL domain-containing protein [Thauera sp.]
MYHSEADRADVERHHFAAGLRHAIERQQLELHFQPLVDARTRRLRAGEALLRWNHPQLGQIPFSRFIGAVRDGSLIARLGDWVLHAACHHARRWPEVHGQPVTLTVNVAIEQVLQSDLLSSVSAALASSGLPAERLELDLDEQVLEEDSPRVTATLRALGDRGIRLAIDDFGRGLSSIPRLKHHPLRALKLHPDLVRGVGRNERDEAVVEAIASMAVPLGLEVFARGVENKAQQAFLCALDCHLQQGPLFGPAVTAEDFRSFLVARG